MPRLRWTDELSMGVEEIDTQHKALILIGGGFVNAVALDREPRVMKNVIRRLREYTVFHFNAEEKLMKKARYPKRGLHAKLHANLKDKVKQYQRRIYKGEKLDVESVQHFLQFWIINHILEADREFANYLHERERKAS